VAFATMATHLATPLKSTSLRNDLYCVEWDVKIYYTILYSEN